MNSALADISNEGLSGPSSDATDKYITFQLADYMFALPSEKILKIVATPPPSQGGMVSMGLVQLEQYSIQILNLTTLLNLPARADESEVASEQAPSTATGLAEVVADKNPPFLMVLQDQEGVLWGIAVDEPPDLMDIPGYALKPVPSEKRLTQALRWVSHVVTYDLAGNRHTLLLLDLAALLSANKPVAKTGADFLDIEPPLALNALDLDSLEIGSLEVGAADAASASMSAGNIRQEEMYA